MQDAPDSRVRSIGAKDLDLARRALCALSHSHELRLARPVHVHRIAHLLREYLRDEAVGTLLERLELLTETVRLARGYWLPAPVRCVNARGVILIVAPFATTDLGKLTGRPIELAGSGRVVDGVPPGVPEQDFWSWTAAPRDTAKWTTELLTDVRNRLRETAMDSASVDAHVARGPRRELSATEVGRWVSLRELQSFSGQSLCRARVSRASYRYFFAKISDLTEDLAAWRESTRDIVGHIGKNAPFDQFLQELQLRSKEPTPKRETVTLMTIHGAKGREFDLVYVIGLAEDVMPSFQSRQKGDSSPEMEEERRNCFVAITRTKECLVLSRARRYRGWQKSPSCFLIEMELV
jgi:UvrD-like helicase C-terminal domain